MAASLPGLPAELLLKIVGYGLPYFQKRAYTALRATCRELNDKLMYFFCYKYFHRIDVSLNRKQVRQLQAISKGSIAVHVEEIQLGVSTLFKHISVWYEDESTDASLCSWFSETELANMGSLYDQYQFDEDVANFITNGSCSQILSKALSQFPNVKSFIVKPPMVHWRMAKQKLEDIRSRWLVACKILLMAFFAKTTGFEHLEITYQDGHLLVPLSALDITAYCMPIQSSLKRVHMDFVADVSEASYPIHVKIFVQLLAKMPVLIDLAISFREAPSELFKQLARTLPELKLQKLKLAHIVTRYKYLMKFIDSSIPTLQSLVLDFLDLTRFDDHVPLCYSLAVMELDDCVLRRINVGGSGLKFGSFNIGRPKFADQDARNLQSELSVGKHDGEDVQACWEEAAESCELGPVWQRFT